MKSGVSLQQMLTEVKRQSESKEDYLIAPNRLRMESYGKEMFLHLSDDSGTELIEPMTITGIAHRQIGTHLHDARIPVNPLYFCGFSRVGCIGCPMAGKHRYFEFARYPQYEKLYLIAFDRMLEERRRRGKLDGSWHMGTTAEDVFHWWMEDDFIRGQMSLEEFLYVC